MDNYVVKKTDAFRADIKNPTRTSYIFFDGEKIKNISGGSVDIPVNSGLVSHAHENEEELMFVYKGRGEYSIDGQSFPIEPETMIFAPAGLEHRIVNTGTETLSVVFFYSPPGPEQNIRVLSRASGD